MYAIRSYYVIPHTVGVPASPESAALRHPNGFSNIPPRSTQAPAPAALSGNLSKIESLQPKTREVATAMTMEGGKGRIYIKQESDNPVNSVARPAGGQNMQICGMSPLPV